MEPLSHICIKAKGEEVCYRRWCCLLEAGMRWYRGFL